MSTLTPIISHGDGLARLAAQLAQSAWKRHLLFLLAALCSIAFIGYHFGTFDQDVHIPSLKATADPTLFRNDPFLELRSQHYSYFWFFFIPLYRAGLLEPAMLITHIVTIYLTFWAIWVLSDTLFHNPLAALLAVLAFIFPHLGYGGFPLLEFSLLNRAFVLPFLLWAIILLANTFLLMVRYSLWARDSEYGNC